ncbi:MAG: hypothetical protein ABJB05_00540 [Parafilimonas sp.]
MKYILFLILIFFSATSNAQSNYVSYNQHGYNLELPDYFLPVASQDANVDVFTNTSNKAITLRIESAPMDKTAFNTKYISEIANSGVTSKLIKDTVYSLSYADNKTVNYHKSFLSNGMAHTLIVTYPNNNKTQFDLILSKIGRSFK